MTIEKLPSGSYRIKQQYKGHRYSVTVPYKPTQKEAITLLAAQMDQVPTKHERTTFAESAAEYVDINENVLSPSTVREYLRIPKRLPKWFTELYTSDIQQADIQKCINELSARLSPKTVHGYHGFISTVLGEFRPTLKIRTNLPQMVNKEPYIPPNSVVKELLDYTLENAPHFYVPIFLGGYSLRRSEMLALTVDDIDEKGFMHINKAMVQDKNNKWVIKVTKTEKSVREIPLPPELVDMIRKQGYVYNCAAQSTSNYMKRTQKKLGMEEFSLHKMRHYCCSRLIEMGYSFKDAQAFCGWSTDITPRTIYAHSLKMKDEEEKKKISAELAKGLF